MAWPKWLMRLVWGRREPAVCSHCGKVGWGNEIGCNELWQSYAANHAPDDWDDEPDARADQGAQE